MKILHTSDLHLVKSKGERWKTLQRIMEVCDKESVDVLTICGDLFNKNPDTEDLRYPIQDTFSHTDFDTLVLPGNHDRDVCSKMFFGNRGRVLDDPSDPWERDGVRFIGLPCDKIKKEEVLDKITDLGDHLSDDMVNVLLYHGELLDSFYSFEDYGEEGKERDMPLKLSYLKELPIKYVLAGHFHKRFQVFPFGNEGHFVYSGSPYPIKKSEINRRNVNIFEIGEEPSKYELVDGPYYEKIDLELNPIENENPLQSIINRISGLGSNAVPLLYVKAYIDSKKIELTDPEIEEKVKKIVRDQTKGKKAEDLVHLNVMDISDITGDEIFKKFIKKLEERGYSREKRQELRDIAIKSMMEAR